MRSRAKATWLALIALAGVGVMATLAAPTTAHAAIDDTEVLDALEEVRKDPNISPERKVRTLKWAGEDKPEERKPTVSVPWLRGLFEWIAGMSRLILWIGIIVVLGLIVLFIKRVVSGASYTKQVRAPDAPTHVQELDIRPESLPDEIGTAALALWERNDHRAALALLYRGLLSRLVHVHGVAIRESTTEADCLKLAVPRLQSEVAQYASMLVRVWQHAVYGAREPAADEMQALCTRFDRSFPAQPVGGAS
ncbi:DUF4129 domain-containing protein [Steroidobacter sp.]|uniref:DUF4129 domain-containing protein n=1 Tax=Steroidobacter sp. TaxID=1978227 RepID=UPI001A62AA4B|nr:DUF4129 domain-containing protein [Steroidobacter sp.]MBL8266123.1 DUF4129 domain-containing protein [Steroidobacter sp.]